MILDTEYLISLQAGETAAVEKATEVEASGRPARIPTIVVWKSTSGSAAVENQRDYERLFEGKPVEELTADTARLAGILMGAHHDSHTKPPRSWRLDRRGDGARAG